MLPMAMGSSSCPCRSWDQERRRTRQSFDSRLSRAYGASALAIQVGISSRPQRVAAERRLMGLTDLFWIFVIFAALQPLVRQKMLQVQRLRLLRRLEKERGSLAITFVHRQETMSFLGFFQCRWGTLTSALSEGERAQEGLPHEHYHSPATRRP